MPVFAFPNEDLSLGVTEEAGEEHGWKRTLKVNVSVWKKGMECHLNPMWTLCPVDRRGPSMQKCCVGNTDPQHSTGRKGSRTDGDGDLTSEKSGRLK